MEASISAEGVLTIKAISELESYALGKWFEDYSNDKAVFHVAIVKENFTHSWEVYQEVVCPAGIADIVAVQGHIKWAIECKLSLSLAVIGQAVCHCPYFHYVSIAVPYHRSNKSVEVAKQILNWKGIGLIRFWNRDLDWYEVYPILPRLNRKAMTRHIKLYDEQKNMVEAGAANGGHFTPFKRTARNINRIVNLKPGIILKDLIEQSDHHYASNSSAKQYIKQYIMSGVIENIKMERDGKFLRFYPVKGEK